MNGFDYLFIAVVAWMVVALVDPDTNSRPATMFFVMLVAIGIIIRFAFDIWGK